MARTHGVHARVRGTDARPPRLIDARLVREELARLRGSADSPWPHAWRATHEAAGTRR